jgi:hypothetical protein
MRRSGHRPHRDQKSFELNFDPKPQPTATELFPHMPEVDQRLAMAVHQHREGIRNALQLLATKSTPDVTAKIYDVLMRMSEGTIDELELAGIMEELNMSGKRVREDGTPNVPYSKLGRIAIAQVNDTRADIETDVQVGPIVPPSPSALEEVLNMCTGPQERDYYEEMIGALKSLDASELLFYAMQHQLTTDEQEHAIWRSERQRQCEPGEIQNAKEWKYGNEKHRAFIHEYRRAYFLQLVQEMIVKHLPADAARQQILAANRDVIRRLANRQQTA